MESFEKFEFTFGNVMFEIIGFLFVVFVCFIFSFGFAEAYKQKTEQQKTYRLIELKKGQSVKIGEGLIPVTMTYKGSFGIKNDSYQLNFNKSKMNLTCQLTGVEISTTTEGNPPSKVKMVVTEFDDNKIVLNLLSCEPIMCYRPGVFVRPVSFGGEK